METPGDGDGEAIETDDGAFTHELDAELARDPERKRRVEALMNEGRVEQDLFGRARNIELRILVKWAAALGARVRITIQAPGKARRPREAAAAYADA